MSAAAARSTTLAEQTVEAITSRLAKRPLSRRRLLTRTSVAATALLVDPLRWILRPTSALATVCGDAASCRSGWAGFCCTINEGRNTCPPGSYAAGWWKVDDSSFCKGSARYYIDCNRLPGSSCQCSCAGGECDDRQVCCNVFRYGQCNQQVPGVTEVVCRVVTCTTPWEWDPSCSTTVRTANATRTHSSACLPGPNPTWIEIRYQDLGLVGSFLGTVVTPERNAPLGGRRTDYQHGAIAWTESTGARALSTDVLATWERTGGPVGDLGYPETEAEVVAGTDPTVAYTTFQRGGIWQVPDAPEAIALHGPIHLAYLRAGGAGGYLGPPTTWAEPVEGPWLRVLTARGWQVVLQTERQETRILRADTELPADGTWPPSDAPVRLSGDSRYATAIAVARHAWPEGADVAYLASGAGFADALGGGVVAALRNGPLLLTDPALLRDDVAAALEALGVAEVVLLGGTSVIAPQVAGALRGRGLEVARLAGTDRYLTAVEISRSAFPTPDDNADGTRGPEVVVATGSSFADALAAAPLAYTLGGPILLVRRDEVPIAVQEELRRPRPSRITVLGGESAISASVQRDLLTFAPEVRRLRGDNRHATAGHIAVTGHDTARTIWIVTGSDFPDALAAGAAAARAGAPILLTDRDRVPAETSDVFRSLRPSTFVMVGGPKAISHEVFRSLTQLLGPQP